MNIKSLILIAVLFAVALIVGRYLAPNAVESTHPAERTQETWCEPSVDACSTTLPGIGEVVLVITPQDAIQPMKPLVAEVTLPGGWQAEHLEATGLNMDMGINRFNFHGGDTGFGAEFLLPLCALTRMEWELTLTIAGENQRLAVPFRFVVERN